MGPEDFPEISPKNFYGRQRYQHLQPALEKVASSSMKNEVDIVIIPPTVDPQTDEEDFDENYIPDELLMPQDVTGEIELQHISDSESEDSDGECNLPLLVLWKNILRTNQNFSQSKKQKLPEPKWTKTFVDTSIPSTAGCADRLEILKSDLENLDPVEIFENVKNFKKKGQGLF